LRALQTLEYIGGAAARRILERMAKGDSHSRLTQHSKGALLRLR
jgi:hypothetical protein